MLYNLLRKVKHRAAAAKAGQGAALLSFLKLGDGMFRRFNGWFARFMYGRYGSDQLNVVLLVLFGYSISMAFHVRLLELFLGTQLDYCTLALILYLVPAVVFGLPKRKGTHIAENSGLA